MNTQERDFLKIISAALTGQTAEFTGYRTEEEWKCLYKISVHQNLWPMIYEKIFRLALYTVVAPDIRNQWMSETVAAAGRQIVQTERFAKLCETLQEHGIRYVVLKGISCKIWYPKSELRPSGDEDILIDPGDLQKVDEILKTLHFINEESIHVPDVKDEQEISYLAQDNSLYVEVHLNVIGKENQMQRHLNSRFYDSLDQTEEIMFEGHRFFCFGADDTDDSAHVPFLQAFLWFRGGRPSDDRSDSGDTKTFRADRLETVRKVSRGESYEKTLCGHFECRNGLSPPGSFHGA